MMRPGQMMVLIKDGRISDPVPYLMETLLILLPKG